MPHNNVMIELFQLTSEEFIEGLEKLQYSLSSAKADVYNNLMESFEQFEKVIQDSDTSNIKDLLDDKERDKCQLLFGALFGYSLYDVKQVTGWNDIIIDSLSYGLNQYNGFFNGEYAGWPILDLPVQKKTIY